MPKTECCLSISGGSSRQKDIEWYRKFDVDMAQLPKLLKKKKEPYKKSRRKKQEGAGDSPGLNPAESPSTAAGIPPIDTKTVSSSANSGRRPSNVPSPSTTEASSKQDSNLVSVPSPGRRPSNAPSIIAAEELTISGSRASVVTAIGTSEALSTGPNPGRRSSNAPSIITAEQSSNIPTSGRRPSNVTANGTSEALSTAHSPGRRPSNIAPAEEFPNFPSSGRRPSSAAPSLTAEALSKHDQTLSSTPKKEVNIGTSSKKFLDVAARGPRSQVDNEDASSDFGGSGGASSLGSNYNAEEEASRAADYTNIIMPETVYVGGVFKKGNMAHYHFNRVCGGKVKKSYPSAKARAKGLLPCTRCVIGQSAQGSVKPS